MNENPSVIERGFCFLEKIVRAVLSFLLKIIHVSLTEKQWTGLLQFFRFGVIGLFNTAFNLLFNYLALWLIDKIGWDGAIGGAGGFDRHLATLAGFLASCVNSYLFNSRYTFGAGGQKSAGQRSQIFLKVVASYSVAGLFLGWALNLFWIQIQLNHYLGALFNVIISMPISFLLNKFWVYRKA